MDYYDLEYDVDEVKKNFLAFGEVTEMFENGGDEFPGIVDMLRYRIENLASSLKELEKTIAEVKLEESRERFKELSESFKSDDIPF